MKQSIQAQYLLITWCCRSMEQMCCVAWHVSTTHTQYLGTCLLIFRSRELFIYKSFLEFRKYLYLKTLCFLGLVFCGELGWMWVRIEGHYCIVLMCCNWNKSVKVIVGLKTESWGCNVIWWLCWVDITLWCGIRRLCHHKGYLQRTSMSEASITGDCVPCPVANCSGDGMSNQ